MLAYEPQTDILLVCLTFASLVSLLHQGFWVISLDTADYSESWQHVCQYAGLFNSWPRYTGGMD